MVTEDKEGRESGEEGYTLYIAEVCFDGAAEGQA